MCILPDVHAAYTCLEKCPELLQIEFSSVAIICI